MNRRDVLKAGSVFLGYSVTAAALSEIFAACQRAPDSKSGSGTFFDAGQLALLDAITETILPRTTTPGARDMKVAAFIDASAATVMTHEQQKQWVDGLRKLDADCATRIGRSFLQCTPDERARYLLEIDKAAGRYPPSVWGISLVAHPEPVGFFRHVKSLTLFGYFTSQKIFTEVLRYDPVPGAFRGCVPLEGKNSWSEGA
jgi:Gluconate 2-dehydrogenase subunit 3